MSINNLKRIKLIKQLFYLVSTILIVIIFLLFYNNEDGWALLFAGILVVWFLIFQSIDFQYLEFSIASGMIVLRYYPAVKFGKKDYQTIEFPVNVLHDFTVESSLFGLTADLTLLVRTKRGIAEYPPISLAAVSKADQEKIAGALNELLHR
ncbi:MAG: hypothetical protein FWG22_05100 [Prolixibacteraceae bacterium]|nr:hypothetical protein [Prolixibacteraceae bacterium]